MLENKIYLENNNIININEKKFIINCFVHIYLIILLLNIIYLIIYYIYLLIHYFYKKIFKFCKFIYRMIFENDLNILNNDLKYLISTKIKEPDDYLNLKLTCKSFYEILNDTKFNFNIVNLKYYIEFNSNDINFKEKISKKFNKTNRSNYFNEKLTKFELHSNNDNFMILIQSYTNDINIFNENFNNFIEKNNIKSFKLKKEYIYYFDCGIFEDNKEFWKNNKKNYILLNKKGDVLIEKLLKEVYIRNYNDFETFLLNNYDFEFEIKNDNNIFIKKNVIINVLTEKFKKEESYLRVLIKSMEEMRDNLPYYVELPVIYDDKLFKDLRFILKRVQVNLQRMLNYINLVNNN